MQAHLTNQLYPKSLQMICAQLSQFSRTTNHMNPVKNNSIGPGQICEVDLPNNTLIDLSTFTMWFQGISSANTVAFTCFSTEIETILDRVEVIINNKNVTNGLLHYNQLFKVLAEFYFGTDKRNARSILQNGLVEAVPTAADTLQQYCINNWLNFFSAQPSIVSTKLLGNIRVRITLA
jgi:hypothetical protein